MKFYLFIISFLALVTAPFAQAQTWPQRPVKLIVPLGPGAGADITGRLLGDRLSKRWNQPVVVENRPGGDGVVGINALLQAKDDHTMMFGPASGYVGHPYTLEKVPYEPKDLLPVARATNTVVAIAAPASLNVNSLKELVDLLRKEPGKHNWASVTGVTDLIIAGFFKSQNMDVAKASYKDTVSAVNDLVGGRIQLYSSAYAIVRPHQQAGRIKVLAVQATRRAPGLDLPTVSELGFPGLNFDGLVGFSAARGTLTDAQRNQVAADVKAVLEDQELAQRLTASGQIVSPGTPAEFAAAIEEQRAQLASLPKGLLKP